MKLMYLGLLACIVSVGCSTRGDAPPSSNMSNAAAQVSPSPDANGRMSERAGANGAPSSGRAASQSGASAAAAATDASGTAGATGAAMPMSRVSAAAGTTGQAAAAGATQSAGIPAMASAGTMAGAAGSAANAASDEVPLAGTLPIAAPAAADCITEVGPGERLVFSDCGENIQFNVSVPEQCLKNACGLIFDVHGYSMSGPVEEQNTNLARLGRENSYIVVQPSAPNASWNGELHYPVVVKFMSLALEVWHIEQRRVHFTGFSQGGRMTWTMRCTQSTKVASAAPIAMSSVECESGLPEREMPVLYTQGESDAFVGEGVGKQVADAFVSEHKMREDQVLASDADYTWTRYVNDEALTFEFIDHKYSTSPTFGAGHCFPGTFTQSSPYGCTQSVPFHVGEEVMKFFIAHPLH